MNVLYYDEKKLTCLFLLVFFAMKGFSQEKYALISGKIISSNNSVGNVHIVNLNTKLGTVSNDSGEFEMMVSLNDILLFSSIEYERKEVSITGNFLKYKKIVVELISKVNELAEVFIEGLTGNLNYDLKKVPKTNCQNTHLFLSRVI